MDFLRKLLNKEAGAILRVSRPKPGRSIGSGILQNPQESNLQQRYNPGYIPLQGSIGTPIPQGSNFNQQSPQIGVTSYYIPPLVQARNRALNNPDIYPTDAGVYSPRYRDLSKLQKPYNPLEDIRNAPRDAAQTALNILKGIF